MANKKITELTALTDPDANDLLAIVDDPSGSPVTKQITATKLVKSLNNQSATFVVAASNSVHKERADYVCDGVDDQVEIQAAIDALPSGGGEIVLADGKFVLTASVLLSKAGVRIQGSTGTQLDIDHSGGFVSCALLIGANHIEISNINFEFTDTTVQTSPPRAISMAGDDEYSNIEIHNCRFIGIKTAGVSGSLKHTTIGKCIEGAAGKHWNIHNNYFCGCSWEGISIGNLAAANYPEYAIITQNTVVGLDDRCYGGIVVEHGARHCVIANNVVRDMGSSIGYGIFVISGDGYPGSQDIVVTGNNVFDTTMYGVLIQESTGVTCTGNVFVGSASGVVINNKSHHILVSGNKISKMVAGVSLSVGAHDIHITGNYITGVSNGVSIEDNSEIFIEGNDISFASQSGVQQPWTAGDPYASSEIFIKNNTFKNTNTGNGTYTTIYKAIGTMSDIIISGNVFRDTQASDTTTLAAAASIGNTVITVDDVSPFSHYEAIEIGADIMYIIGIDHYNKTITFVPALANDHVLGSAVSGKTTSYKPLSIGSGLDMCASNDWTGLLNNPSSFNRGAENIGIDGDWFLSRAETQTFRKTVNYDDTSPVAICAVKDGYAVTDVWVEVTTTFDDVGAKLKIGDGGNILGFLCSADGTNNVIDLTSAGYYGVNDDQREAYLWDNINSHRIQKVYTASDTIDATITKTDGSQGQAIVYVKITRIGG